MTQAILLLSSLASTLPKCWLCAMGLTTLILEIFFLSAVSAKTDAALFAKIDSLRQIAGQILIDGNGSDWIGIPAFTDPGGDAGGDGSRDVVGFAIAPRVDDILFLITTAGIPSLNNLAFTLELDFMGGGPATLK